MSHRDKPAPETPAAVSDVDDPHPPPVQPAGSRFDRHCAAIQSAETMALVAAFGNDALDDTSLGHDQQTQIRALVRERVTQMEQDGNRACPCLHTMPTALHMRVS